MEPVVPLHGVVLIFIGNGCCMAQSTSFIDVVSDRITSWVGSTSSLVVHTLLFIASFASHWVLGVSFDTVLLVLTTVVSLEAIYISIFIQRAVNQQGERLEDVEESIDDVEEALDDVEEALDEVEESLNDAEEDIADIPTDTLKQLQQPMEEMARRMEELLKELQASRIENSEREK